MRKNGGGSFNFNQILKRVKFLCKPSWMVVNIIPYKID